MLVITIYFVATCIPAARTLLRQTLLLCVCAVCANILFGGRSPFDCHASRPTLAMQQQEHCSILSVDRMHTGSFQELKLKGNVCRPSFQSLARCCETWT